MDRGAGLALGLLAFRPVLRLEVQRAGEKPGGRGLADAAHAGQHESMRDPARLERIRERAHHSFLADQVLEPARTVFPRQHLIGPGPRMRRIPEQGGGGFIACGGIVSAHVGPDTSRGRGAEQMMRLRRKPNTPEVSSSGLSPG